MPDLQPVAQTEGELRVPFVTPGSLRTAILFPLILLVVLAAIVLSQKPSPTWWVAPLVFGLPSLAIIVSIAISLRRYGRRALVLNDEGVWLEGGRPEGFAWNEIAGYNQPDGRNAPLLRVIARDGRRIEIPLDPWVGPGPKLRQIVRELDQRIGPDGERPKLATTQSVLDLRWQQHHGNLPAVQMEPGVVYRYADRGGLASFLRSRLLMLGVGVLLFTTLGSVAHSRSWPIALIVLGSGSGIAFALTHVAQTVAMIKRIDDPFVFRNGTLFVLRSGREVALPAAQKGFNYFVLGHPITRHGTGFLAYRMLPQFLEPDV
jgi:hypothetical protein